MRTTYVALHPCGGWGWQVLYHGRPATLHPASNPQAARDPTTTQQQNRLNSEETPCF